MAKKDAKKTTHVPTVVSTATSTNPISSASVKKSEFDVKIAKLLNTPDLQQLYQRLKRNVAASEIDTEKVTTRAAKIFRGNAELEKEFYKVYNVSFPKTTKKSSQPVAASLAEVAPEPLKTTSNDKSTPKTENKIDNEKTKQSAKSTDSTGGQHVNITDNQSAKASIDNEKNTTESVENTKTSRTPSNPLKKSPIVKYAQLRFLAKGMAGIQDPTLASIGYTSLLLSTITKSSSLKNLSNMISDFRMFCRMWSTPGVLEWGLDTADKAQFTCKDALDENIVKLEAYSSILYQLLENVAYLSSKRVIRLSAKLEAKLWIYSCIMWSLYVQLELIRIARRLLSGKEAVSYKGIITNLAWLPLTIHWSSEKGFLSQSSVGILGGIASLCNAVGQWKKLANS